MGTITAIEKEKRGRLVVYIDGAPALSIASEVALASGLARGQEIRPRQVSELQAEDELHRAMQTAVRYLSYRPRSEKEVRDRLRKGAYRGDTVGEALTRLAQMKLTDDVAFAQFWKESREASRPRSRRVLRQELKRKGLDAELVGDVVQGVDEEEGAYRVAAKRASYLAGLDEKAFCRRLGTLLQRRGYGYDLARRVVERLWQERCGPG